MSKLQTNSNGDSALGKQAQAVQADVNQLMNDAPGMISGALQDAQALARNGIDRARQASARVRDQVGLAGEKTVGYIQDEPVKSVLIAAAVGAVSAALIGWLARSRADR